MQFSPKGRSKGSGFDAYGQSGGRPPRHGVQRTNSHGSSGSANEVPIIIGDYNDALGNSQALGRTSFSAPVAVEKQKVNFWGNQQPQSNRSGGKNAPSSASASMKPRQTQQQPQGYFSPKSSNTSAQAQQNMFNSPAPLSFYPQQQQQPGGVNGQQNGIWQQNPPTTDFPLR